MHILMITTSNNWDDTRMFWLEGHALTKLGMQVTILAINSKADIQEKDGINIVALGRERKRLGRFLINPREVIRFCRENAGKFDILQVHDPEMLPWIPRLKKVSGCPVVYDMHEFLPDILAVRPWVPRFLRNRAPLLGEAIERRTLRNANAVLVVNELMEQRVRGLGVKEAVVFMGVPSKAEVERAAPYDTQRTGAVYVGGVAMLRGVDTMAKVAPQLWQSHGCQVVVAGPLEDQAAQDAVTAAGIDYRGVVSRSQVMQFLNKAAVGWLPLHHTPNHDKTWAVKLGEYMAAGLPVVSSGLNYCHSIIKKYDCGIVVSADDANAHLEALRYLLDHLQEAKRMGENGQKAILADLNLEKFTTNLCNLYERISQ